MLDIVMYLPYSGCIGSTRVSSDSVDFFPDMGATVFPGGVGVGVNEGGLGAPGIPGGDKPIGVVSPGAPGVGDWEGRVVVKGDRVVGVEMVGTTGGLKPDFSGSMIWPDLSGQKNLNQISQ